MEISLLVDKTEKGLISALLFSAPVLQTHSPGSLWSLCSIASQYIVYSCASQLVSNIAQTLLCVRPRAESITYRIFCYPPNTSSVQIPSCFPFCREETEVSRGLVTCPKSHRDPVCKKLGMPQTHGSESDPEVFPRVDRSYLGELS